MRPFARLAPVPLAALAALALAVGPAGGQSPLRLAPPDPPERGGGLWLALLGGLGGLGLAVAHVNPEGEGWLMSDEAAVVVALGAGVAVAYLVHATTPAGPVAGDVPRLVVSMGTGTDMSHDYALGYRLPLARGGALEATVVAMSHSWNRVERETRCGWFLGCITGDFLVDYRYRRNVALLVRRIYEPAGGWPALAVGAGPAVAHLELHDEPPVRSAAAVLDAALGVARGGRTRWSAELGGRLVLAGTGDPAGRDMSGAYARVGVAVGARR